MDWPYIITTLLSSINCQKTHGSCELNFIYYLYFFLCHLRWDCFMEFLIFSSHFIMKTKPIYILAWNMCHTCTHNVWCPLQILSRIKCFLDYQVKQLVILWILFWAKKILQSLFPLNHYSDHKVLRR